MSAVEQLRLLADERFAGLYEALAQGGFGPLDGEVAKALKFRPQAIRKLPLDKRAKKAREIVLARNNAELAYEILGAYLMKEHKGLITEFLDATGITHEDGMIADLDEEPKLDDLAGILERLDAEHGAENVTLYLALCVQMWPESGQLAETWRTRAGA